MRILLVNPGQEDTFFGLSEVGDAIGIPGFMPNIALPTLASLCGADVSVRIVDRHVEEVPYDEDWDLVGITGYISQRHDMFETARAFRERGQLVAIGGPYATLSPDTVRPHCDILFRGEAERIWPAFLDDFRNGSWKTEYHEPDAIDLEASPLPELHHLDNDRYWIGVVQTSRGCPFRCEFCDVIVYLGRQQRHKSPERVVEELENTYRAGYRRCSSRTTTSRRSDGDRGTS